MVLPKKSVHHLKQTHTHDHVSAVHTHTNRINRSHCNWIKFGSHEKCFCHEATARKNGVIFQVNRVYRCCVLRIDGNTELHEKCSFQQKIETIERHEINTFFFATFFLFVFAVLHFQKFGEVIRFEDLAPWTVQLFIVNNSSIPCEYSNRYNTTQWWRQKYPIFSAKHIPSSANKVHENRLSVVIVRCRGKKTQPIAVWFHVRKIKKSIWDISPSQTVNSCLYHKISATIYAVGRNLFVRTSHGAKLQSSRIRFTLPFEANEVLHGVQLHFDQRHQQRNRMLRTEKM